MMHACHHSPRNLCYKFICGSPFQVSGLIEEPASQSSDHITKARSLGQSPMRQELPGWHTSARNGPKSHRRRGRRPSAWIYLHSYEYLLCCLQCAQPDPYLPLRTARGHEAYGFSTVSRGCSPLGMQKDGRAVDAARLQGDVGCDAHLKEFQNAEKPREVETRGQKRHLSVFPIWSCAAWELWFTGNPHGERSCSFVLEACVSAESTGSALSPRTADPKRQSLQS